MRKFLMLPALALAMAASLAPALASDDDHDGAPGPNWMTVAQITERFTSQGYEVRQVKVEDGGYELYAIDKDGKRIEAYVDPVSGDLLKQKLDD